MERVLAVMSMNTVVLIVGQALIVHTIKIITELPRYNN